MLNEFCRFSFIVFFLRCSLIESVAWNHIPASIIPIQFQLFLFPEDEIAWSLNCLLSDQRQFTIRSMTGLYLLAPPPFVFRANTSSISSSSTVLLTILTKWFCRTSSSRLGGRSHCPPWLCDFIAYASAHI